MERIQAIEQAVEIVVNARRKVVSNDGAWQFLNRVQRYLDNQSQVAFDAEFKEVSR